MSQPTDIDAIQEGFQDGEERFIQPEANVEETERRLALFTEQVRNALQSLSLSIGITSGLHEVTHTLELDGGTFYARLGLGAASGAAALLLGRSLVQYTGGSSWSALRHQGENGKAIARFCFSGFGTLALWSGPILFGHGVYRDARANRSTVDDIQAKADQIEAYREAPNSLPAVLEAIAEFHKTVILSTDVQGKMTAQSLAKMALLFDGQIVEWNPQVQEGLSIGENTTWRVEHNGQSWEIISFNPKSWLVIGGTESWWISEDANGQDPVSYWGQGFGGQKGIPELKESLSQSGKFNGIPAVDELINNMEPLAPLPSDFVPNRAWTFALLPFEVNEEWRDRNLHSRQAQSTVWNADCSRKIEDAHEALFDDTLLSEPNSYPNLLANIDSY